MITEQCGGVCHEPVNSCVMSVSLTGGCGVGSRKDVSMRRRAGRMLLPSCKVEISLLHFQISY